jgi:molecular chaperone HtpG
MSEQTMDFSADVSRLLDIVAHALYTNNDVFLRELISNASDACDKLRYESLANKEITSGKQELQIRVYKDTDARTVNVVDNGIGMDKEDLIEHLGTIAKSGTANMMNALKEANDESAKLNLIGQFGVGFYASFMVAHKVEVVSRKAGEKTAWLWSSDGRTGYTIREATKAEAKHLIGDQGTAVMLHMNDEQSAYLIDEKLTQVIETYSDHISFPIYIGREDAKDESTTTPVNQVQALWMRQKTDISEEEYANFFRHVSFGFDDPLCTSHWRAEGKIEYTALLFIPTMRPMDLYDASRNHAVKLYVKRVFITDDCKGLIFPWLRFLRGVIDSEDLPLNISRESLQHNPLIARISNNVARRVLNDLDKLSRSDPAKFDAFWGQFGPVLKEGLYDAFEHREPLLKVTRFYSSHEDGVLTSLEDYASRMKEKQDRIYYISGENIDTLKNSPQIEGLKARGYEVLFFTDTIDDFWLQTVLDFQGKPFQSVTKGDINLDEDEDSQAKDGDKEKPKKKDKKYDESLHALRDVIADILGDEVGDVKLSTRLVGSPVCLVAGKDDVDLKMERYLRLNQQYESKAKRVLEINPDHGLIKRLAALSNEQTKHISMDDAAYLLLDQARIIQGEPVPDPSSFARRMSLMMEHGLAA